jgi:hypothetical protein
MHATRLKTGAKNETTLSANDVMKGTMIIIVEVYYSVYRGPLVTGDNS